MAELLEQDRGAAAPAGRKKGPRCGPLSSALDAQAAVASAFTLAARRLLWRAALFLWNRFLSATESITGCATLNSSAALALSPASTAFCTFLITVRNCERSAVLAALSLTSCRARFSPEAMRTVFFLALVAVAMGS